MHGDVPSRRRKLATLAISSAVSAVVLWFGLRWLHARAPAPIEIRRPELPLSSVLRDGRDMSEVIGIRPLPSRPKDWPLHLGEADAGQFFGFGEYTEYDPWTYARPRPKRDVVMPWPEHPAGRVVMNTSSIGCRETHELADPPSDLRVLVAGDSHTFGVCNDSEVLTELLENALRARHPGRTVEVLNAAAGGFSFVNYLGTYHRLRSFRPHVFLVVAFAGNDFTELMQPSMYFTGIRLPPDDPQRIAKREAALEREPSVVAQGLDSLESARMWPRFRARMLRDAAFLCREMKRAAGTDGARLVVALLPSPVTMRWPDDPEPPGRRSIESFAITDEDVRREIANGERFLAALAADGIEAVDLRPALAGEPTPPFWRHDLHLSTRGHELVAAALLPVVDRELSAVVPPAPAAGAKTDTTR